MPVQRNSTQRNPPETIRSEESRPSRGGTRGYSQDTREMAMEVSANGDLQNPAIQHLQGVGLFPSNRSIDRWHERQDEHGNVRPFEMTGNHFASALQGHKMLMLVFFRLCYPKATAAEVNAFLFDCTLPGEQPRFFTESQITAAEQWLGLSRKRGSTTAKQANYPINIAKRHVFWNNPYPAGIQNTSRSTIIDWDEAGIFLETTNRTHGKCFVSSRVNEEGPYNHSQKYTLIAAISGGPNGACWFDFKLKAGTTVLDTYDFLDGIITNLGDGGIGGAVPTHTFICDNLSSHHNPLVRTLIHNHGHHLLFRAPYNPWDGPIEYFFNYIQQELSMKLYEIDNSDQLEQAINEIVFRAGQTPGMFDRFFAHCGYDP